MTAFLVWASLAMAQDLEMLDGPAASDFGQGFTISVQRSGWLAWESDYPGAYPLVFAEVTVGSWVGDERTRVVGTVSNTFGLVTVGGGIDVSRRDRAQGPFGRVRLRVTLDATDPIISTSAGAGWAARIGDRWWVEGAVCATTASYTDGYSVLGVEIPVGLGVAF